MRRRRSSASEHGEVAGDVDHERAVSQQVAMKASRKASWRAGVAGLLFVLVQPLVEVARREV